MMSKIYNKDFNNLIVDDIYRDFLDIIANYCDSFSLSFNYRVQLLNDDELSILSKCSEIENESSLNQIYKLLMYRHSEIDKANDSKHLLDISQYDVLKRNFISVKITDVSRIHCNLEYRFHLNSETTGWLKLFKDIFAVKNFAIQNKQNFENDSFFYDRNEYEFVEIGFEYEEKKQVVSLSSENSVIVYGTKLIEDIDAFISQVRFDIKKRFEIFRDNFLSLKNVLDNKAVNYMINKFNIDFFSPLMAMKKLQTFDKYDSEIVDFYYNDSNMKLLAKLFIKAIQFCGKKELCFSWFAVQKINNFDNIKRPLCGENIVSDFLLSLEKKELSMLCEKEIKENLLHNKDLYILDKIVRICEARDILFEDFSSTIRDLVATWCETLPNLDDSIENHAKQFIIRWMYKDKLKKQINETHESLDFTNYIKRFSDSNFVSNYTKSRIAYHYYFGFGVQLNYTKAVEWFKKVVDVFTNCQYDLARCYLNGWGTEKDIEQAKYWFGKAAENGHTKAREQLDLIAENKV